ncbi:MaoC family dehydratase [Halalkalibacter krulwichiae]|uniref:(R)-specific enoyl-CoA hydratase n=1 Tax=Halalkalibacter krulwichiae TaxID=199441 RepID=A0A1X9M9A8_9BACI|nr:MaoC/PaaZ C-terminal domain-containing protein [Halalkalibacter krulwichiae]ARK29977.1 (R)-specific enoyl-CoA hydratase [Halalkalibacter krulwichiae]
MGFYWEEFSINDQFQTEEITVEEKLVQSFSELSGDTNPNHTNPSEAKKSIYKRPIAHGMLIVSLFTGLNRKLGILKGTSLGVIHVEWSFKKPVYVGDTIYYSIQVIDKKETSKTDRGLLKRKVCVIHKDTNCIAGEGTFLNLVKRKAGSLNDK